MLLSLINILVATIVIWWFSNKLEEAAHTAGAHLKLPTSVKGAVLYAIPSSFPEFATAVLAVFWGAKPEFGVGLGTVAGSAVFNILLIPAFSVLVAAAAMRKQGQSFDGIHISPRVFLRDGIFYLLVVIAFMCVIFSGHFTRLYAWLFLGGYAFYVGMLYVDTKRHRKGLDNVDDESDEELMTPGAAAIWLVVSVAALGVACLFLVEHTIKISHLLGMNSYVVAVILTAAATSIPDTLISVAVARKGGEHAEDAIVNAFSSNIFDILICLSVPVLLYGAPIPTEVDQSSVSIVMLVLCTVIALVLCKTGNKVTRWEAWVLIAMYALFIASAIFNEPLLRIFNAMIGS